MGNKIISQKSNRHFIAIYIFNLILQQQHALCVVSSHLRHNVGIIHFLK